MSFESWLRYGSDDTKISAASASTKPSSTIRLSTGDPLLDRLAELDDDNFQAEKEAKLAVQVNFAEESDQKVLRNAILVAMENPYYLEGRSAAGGGRFLLNAPSILSGRYPVPITFGRREAVHQLLRAAASDDRVAQKFKEAVLGQLPKAKKERLLKRLLKFEKNELPDLEEKVREYRKNSKRLLKFEGWDSHLKLRRGEDVQCFRPPGSTLQHPDWYVGFVRDSYMDIDGTSPYSSPTGRILFGGGNDPQRAMAIHLPGVPSTPRLRVHFCTQLLDYDGSVPSDLLGIMRDLQFSSIDPFYLYLFYWSQTVSDAGLDVPEGETYVIVWHYPFWKCCFESLGKYGLDASSYGYCTNIFDSLALVADNHPDYFSLQLPINITTATVVLNDVEICRIDTPRDVLPTRFTIPFYLKPEIQARRLEEILPETAPYSFVPHPGPSPPEMVNMAKSHPIITEIMGELGQAWSPKYGAKWEYLRENDIWSAGPVNWCTESSIFFMLQANERVPLLAPIEELKQLDGYGTEVSGNNVLRWFKCGGRYIDGASADWEDVGRLVMPGSWTSVDDHEHFGFFLYWTRPPMIYHSNDPGHSDNDTQNARNADWDRWAAHFDPTLKVNRFRMISGNWADRVRVANWSLIRVDNNMELEAWRYRQRFSGAYDVNGNPIYEGPKSDDNKDIQLMFWRNGNFSHTFILQDGFGQVAGPPLFQKNLSACGDVNWGG